MFGHFLFQNSHNTINYRRKPVLGSHYFVNDSFEMTPMINYIDHCSGALNNVCDATSKPNAVGKSKQGAKTSNIYIGVQMANICLKKNENKITA